MAKVNIIKSIEANIPKIDIDKDRLTQVLLNIFINGIQAMDFLNRKVAGNNGASLDVLIREIKATILTAKGHDNLNELAIKLEAALVLFEVTCKNTGNALLSKHMISAFACAHPLMEAAGDIIIAWMLLWRANIAIKKIETKEKDFYQGKIKTAQFFITTIIPATIGKLTAITYENNPVASMEERLF